VKPIGLIGGMSWESSAEYYRLVNEEARQRLCELHSAQCVLYSLDFAEVEQLQSSGAWVQAGVLLAHSAAALERAGAGLIVLCTNTMHRVAAAIEQAVTIPFLHIADPAADAVREAGLGTVGLLGTRYTMEGEFYRARLEDRHGLRVLVPEAADRGAVNATIYEELVLGEICESSRQRLRSVIDTLGARGAQGVVLGCTELGLLIRPSDVGMPIFDTTRLHAKAAVTLAQDLP
jgi:aspartate racemase